MQRLIFRFLSLGRCSTADSNGIATSKCDTHGKLRRTALARFKAGFFDGVGLQELVELLAVAPGWTITSMVFVMQHLQ